MSRILRPPVFDWRAVIVRSGLEASARHVALTLSLHMSAVGDSCWPGVALLAQESGLSERTVRTHLATLVERGYLTRLERGGRAGDAARNASYEATVPELRDRQPLPVDNPQPATSDTPNRQPATPPTGNERHRTKDEGAIEDVHERTTGAVAVRRRDELWEAVLEGCGIDSTAITASARGSYNRAVRELRDVGATPDLVRVRVANYRQHFGEAALTPPALAKHWAKVEHPPERGPRLLRSTARAVQDPATAEALSRTMRRKRGGDAAGGSTLGSPDPGGQLRC